MFMIVRICGGLGNQMFQYAFAKALQFNTGCNVKVDLSLYRSITKSSGKIDNVHNGFELENLFALKIDEASEMEIKNLAALPNSFLGRVRRKYFTPKDHFIDKKFLYQPNLFSSSYRYFDGYWQTEKYFIDIKDDILTDFSFKKPFSERNVSLLSKMGRVPLSIHIRRGDYLASAEYNSICSMQYYKNALQTLFSKRKPSSILIFSDDIEWAKLNMQNIIDEMSVKVYTKSFNKDAIFYVDWNKGKNSWQDMALMARCSSHIIANSTFSWWGAWLDTFADKIVIAPELWSYKLKSSYYHYDFSDVVPSSWIKVPIN